MPYDLADPLRDGLLSASALRAVAEQAALTGGARAAGDCYQLLTPQGELLVPGSAPATSATPTAGTGFSFVQSGTVGPTLGADLSGRGGPAQWANGQSTDFLRFSGPHTQAIAGLTAEQIAVSSCLPVLVCPLAGTYQLLARAQVAYSPADPTLEQLVGCYLWQGGRVLFEPVGGTTTTVQYQEVGATVLANDAQLVRGTLWLGAPQTISSQPYATFTLAATVGLQAGDLLAVTSHAGNFATLSSLYVSLAILLLQPG